VEQRFAAWLRKNRWTVLSESYGKSGFPDIVAQDPQGKKVIFEVKADRPKGEGRKSSERSVDYPTLIGQICTRMSDPHADYGVVFRKRSNGSIPTHHENGDVTKYRIAK